MDQHREHKRSSEEFMTGFLPSSNAPERDSHKNHRFDDVFVKSGMPHITFVEHQDFKKLKNAIARHGRGVIIEGPSGIGKTTMVRKAIEELGNSGIRFLSARKQKDLQDIQTIEEWHRDTVIIDDFHRLNETLRQQIVRYLLALADTERENVKLVIIGIPHMRQKLISLPFDLATRADVLCIDKVEDPLIYNMIEKGEQALHIRFKQKSDIVQIARGSFNVAQYLCWNICSREDTLETLRVGQPREICCAVDKIEDEVIDDLSMKFGETLRYFAALGGHRNTVSLHLLEELAQCEDGFLSLSHLRSKRRDLATNINRFIQERWIDSLYENLPDSRKQFFFDPVSEALVADDPQLIFYLNAFLRGNMTRLLKETGKVTPQTQRRIFICHDERDSNWLKRLQVYLRPLERDGQIDIWDTTRIAPGSVTQDEIQEALECTRVALILVSADLLASDFLMKYELPELLSRAVSGGTTIIPIIVSYCLFAKSRLAVFQPVNPVNPVSMANSFDYLPLRALDENQQERVLLSIAESVSTCLGNREV